MARFLLIKAPDGHLRETREGAEVGDVLVCPNGHELADVTGRLRNGENLGWGHTFRFRSEAVQPGTPREACKCPECGAIWLAPDEEAR